MKKILLMVLVILSGTLAGIAQEIVEKDGIYYNGSSPFSGIDITKYSDGNKKMEVSYVDGKKEGICKIWFENGVLNEVRYYKNNEMDGTWVVYNEAGVKTSVANYTNGFKNGKWLIWNDKGLLIYRLSYKNGEKSGVWKNYDDEGKLINKRYYKSGEK
jgi:antitoxin component YwqK of YwqJK toxin-antitoxin module